MDEDGHSHRDEKTGTKKSVGFTIEMQKIVFQLL